MRVLLRWDTALGARVLCCEGGDAATARAIAEAHRALGLDACTLDEAGRFDMKAHLRRNKLRLAKAMPAAGKVVPIRNPKP